MPFDPALPAEDSELQSAVMRSQFTALFDLIGSIVTIIAAQVDGVTTLPAGSPANVIVTVNTGTLHFTFEIPQGADGPPGPPFANAIVDGVTTLDPGQPATVDVSFDGTNVHFSFGIPRGSEGAPGEVTQAALDTAIATTAQNPAALSPLSLTISDPPTQAEVQTLVDAYDALLAALQH